MPDQDKTSGGAATQAAPFGASWVLSVADLIDQVGDDDARLRALVALRTAVEDRLPTAVARLRAEGATWDEVAAVLGISRQSAWERFHRLAAPPPHPPGGPPKDGSP